MRKKWFYVIGWSAALLVGTLPGVFKGSLKFSLRGLSMGEVCDVYMFPVVIALVLLMADVLYTSEHEKAKEGRVKATSTLIICIMVFLFAFIFSLWLESSWICWICFAIVWISMAVLKFIKTDAIEVDYCPNGFEAPK